MAGLARCVDTDLTPESLLAIAEREGVDLTVVGPEAPLVAGVVDGFEAAGRKIFGPNRRAARLEGSKRFAKDFMARYNIPTAHYRSFKRLEPALGYLRKVGIPIVVKDSALAAGKGVTVARERGEAEAALERIFDRPGGAEVVLEELLEGQEVSLLVLTDGESAQPLLVAQDYKQALDGDEGPMTGGMGVIAPAPLLNEAELSAVMTRVVTPTLVSLRKEGVRYRGVLFFGLMLTKEGVKVLEYNVRFGDPETQAVLPLLENDLLDVLEAVVEGRLRNVTLHWKPQHAACVVMAAPGYPGTYEKGIGLEIPDLADDVTVFHAGTERRGKRLLSSGGRVLGVTAVGAGLEEAVARAYQGVARTGFPGAHYRRDIGGRVV